MCACVCVSVCACLSVCEKESVCDQWLVEKFLVSSWGGVRYRAGTSRLRAHDYKCINTYSCTCNTLCMYMYMHKVHVPSLVHCLGQR